MIDFVLLSPFAPAIVAFRSRESMRHENAKQRYFCGAKGDYLCEVASLMLSKKSARLETISLVQLVSLGCREFGFVLSHRR